jgi:hypothetical protein
MIVNPFEGKEGGLIVLGALAGEKLPLYYRIERAFDKAKRTWYSTEQSDEGVSRPGAAGDEPCRNLDRRNEQLESAKRDYILDSGRS